MNKDMLVIVAAGLVVILTLMAGIIMENFNQSQQRIACIERADGDLGRVACAAAYK